MTALSATSGMLDKDALQFSCSDAVTGYIHDIIDASNHPEIAVLIATRTVAGEIILPRPSCTSRCS
jgi:hypothetical protein